MASDMADLQKGMVNLQRQMCRQMEAAQATLSIPHVTESTVVKPTLFYGRENENVDRWLQRFALYLAHGKIAPTSNQAAIKLALHLSGPAETFYYNLPSTVKSSYTLLKDALQERLSSTHRHLRNRQDLSKRRQGANESIESLLADLNEKFNCLDLRDEDKLCYLIQALRPDIQAEVLKKESKTYAQAEDTARLIYSIQQSTFQRREEDVSRIVQSATQVTPSTSQTAPSSPEEKTILASMLRLLDRNTNSDHRRIELLEKEIQRLTVQPVGSLPHDQQTAVASPPSVTDNHVAAYQPVSALSDTLRCLQEQMRHLNDRMSENPTVAAYQYPTSRDNNSTRENDELTRLREENRRLKAAQREPQRDSPRRDYADLCRIFNEIQRLQSRMDGFMRVYANKSSREEPPRVRMRDGRPYCDICHKIGHTRSSCYSRNQPPDPGSRQHDGQNHAPYQQRNHSIAGIASEQCRTAAFKQEVTPTNPLSHQQTQPTAQGGQVHYARRSQPLSSTPGNRDFATINTIDTATLDSPQKKKSKKKNEINSDPARDHTVTVQDKQEIVIRLEIHTNNQERTPEEKTAMQNVIEEHDHQFTDQALSVLKNQSNSTKVTSSLPPVEGKLDQSRGETIEYKIEVHPKTRRIGQVSERLQKGQSSMLTETVLSSERPFLPSVQQQGNAFVTGQIHGCPIDLLVDTGACISVIDAGFVREILSEVNPPVMASSTYSEVETVGGDKMPTIGQLQVPLSFNGRQFTCQFHVIENMTYNAVLGRDFLLPHGAVINFASGTVSLDKVDPIELTVKPIDLRPLASLSVHNSHPTNRNHDEKAAPFLAKLIPGDHFGQHI